MKTPHFIFAILLCFVFTTKLAKAKVLTVNNNTNSAGMYTKAQDAHDAASAGDTLYIHPSEFTYGTLYVRKKLTIIGGGYRRDESPEPNWISQFDYIYLDEYNNLNQTDSSMLIGLYATTINMVLGQASYTCNYITIDRCFFYDIRTCGNYWLVKNSVVSYIYVNNNTNFIATNNLLTVLSTSNHPSVLFLNNFFCLPSGFSTWNINSIENAIFENNIFFNPPSTVFSSVNFNIFNNNAFVTNSTTFTSIPGTKNIDKKNLFVSISNFKLADGSFGTSSTVQQPPSRTAGSQFNKDNWTFQLDNSSPGKNYGTDGTDIGIYGGGYPMQNLNGLPSLPFITEFNIHNPVIAPNEDLDFNVKSKTIK